MAEVPQTKCLCFASGNTNTHTARPWAYIWTPTSWKSIERAAANPELLFRGIALARLSFIALAFGYVLTQQVLDSPGPKDTRELQEQLNRHICAYVKVGPHLRPDCSTNPGFVFLNICDP